MIINGVFVYRHPWHVNVVSSNVNLVQQLALEASTRDAVVFWTV